MKKQYLAPSVDVTKAEDVYTLISLSSETPTEDPDRVDGYGFFLGGL